MSGIREAIEDVLAEELPWTFACPYCEREFDVDYDLEEARDRIADIIESVIKRASNSPQQTPQELDKPEPGVV